MRALQREYDNEIQSIIAQEIVASFGSVIPSSSGRADLTKILVEAVREVLDLSTTKDAVPRLESAGAATTTPLVNYFIKTTDSSDIAHLLEAIGSFRSSFAKRGAEVLQTLRYDYLTGARGPAPAAPYIGRSRPVYEFIRIELGIKMHGLENFERFENGFGDITVGGSVSLIYESICDGKMQGVVSALFTEE